MTDQRQTTVHFLDISGQDRHIHPYRQPTDFEKLTSTPQLSERQSFMSIVVFRHRIHNEANTQLPGTDTVSRDKCEIVPDPMSLPGTRSAIQPKYRALFEDTSLYKVIVRRDRRYHPYKRPKEYFRRHRRHNIPYYQDYRYFSSDVRKQLKMAAGNDNLVEDHVIHHVPMSTTPELEIQTPVDWSLVDWGITPLTKSDYTQMREWETESETSLTDTCSNTRSNANTDAHKGFSTKDSSYPEKIDMAANRENVDQCKEATVDTTLNGVAIATAPAVCLPEPGTAENKSTKCESKEPEIETDVEEVLLADPDGLDLVDNDLSLSESSIDLLLDTTKFSDKETAPTKHNPSECANNDVTQASNSDIAEHREVNPEEKRGEKVEEENTTGEIHIKEQVQDVNNFDVSVDKQSTEVGNKLQLDKLDTYKDEIKMCDKPFISGKGDVELPRKPHALEKLTEEISTSLPSETHDKYITPSGEKYITKIKEVIEPVLPESKLKTEIDMPFLMQKLEPADTGVGGQGVNLQDTDTFQDDTSDDFLDLTQIDTRLADAVLYQDVGESGGCHGIIKKTGTKVSTSKDTKHNSDSIKTTDCDRVKEPRIANETSTLMDHQNKHQPSPTQKHRKTSYSNESDVDDASIATKKPRFMYINRAMMSQFEAMVNHGATQSKASAVNTWYMPEHTFCVDNSSSHPVEKTDTTPVLATTRHVNKSVSEPVKARYRPAYKSGATDSSSHPVEKTDTTQIYTKTRSVNKSVSEPVKPRYKPAYKFGITDSLRRSSEKTEVAPIAATMRVNVCVSEPVKPRYRLAYKSGGADSVSQPLEQKESVPLPSTSRRLIRLNPNRECVDRSDDREGQDHIAKRRVLLPNRDIIQARPHTIEFEVFLLYEPGSTLPKQTSNLQQLDLLH